ncbi:acetylornithine deacetylase/succinyl-diaminopimelate desuccinylase-like protein [Labedella gwakjiensis]|uniref:Acetylornithine deacetylase/succinyl-diaminopimelate desuccinylase-like protein n=1 Tax=Labedella gwakjiensis TaxID=390269 RepID=A0A2P8H078_9MICO|nr:dipeptidase [Labedella gwakjiensis]PSL39599.1 acetylornithine deacetylase/succinyl-diaminopimelate desuccinylase-like protein [Labedella gwakjiensis]RUQ86008.1 dipeptidase [Labedella gwakjiensis]
MSHSPADSVPAAERDSAITDAVRLGLPTTIADLSALVRIPSVSWAAFDPAHVQASAESVAALAESTGVFDSVRIARATIGDTDEVGQPAVLARRSARNGAPTILLYAHHDVQPPGKDEDWDTEPFEPTVRGDRLYGRGAADDKAGVMAHIASIRALTEVLGPDFDLGIALFIEGEEEFGSRSFETFLADNAEELRADAIVVADSGNWDEVTPALTVSLRGNVTFRLSVRPLEHASHSGMFGGAVPDAMLVMIRLLDSFWNEDGSVAVEGLSSHVGETPDYSEAQLRSETGLVDGVGPIGSGSLLSRIWWQPSITVTGIDAPTVANASNTLIPEVSVRVSARIAPGQSAQDAADALISHIRAHTPFGVVAQVDDIDTGNPFLVDTSGPIVAATKKSMADAWGVEPVDFGVGGSIPFIASLVESFPDAEILVTGVEDPHSRAHSPNESLHLGVFHRAVLAEALLLARLSAGER